GWEPNSPDVDGTNFQTDLLQRARQHYKVAGPALMASAAPVATTAGPMGAGNQSLHLPQTATLSELYLLIGLILLSMGLIVWWIDPWRGNTP
ncbi:MAG: hypothetical protein HOB79_05875, partial [Rhodospirillaceae bacterium]|nr:hypothetical protein [Rhodospirillaceae bacterium]